MLIIQDLTYRIAGKTLLNEVNLRLLPRQHVGLIGANGTGKSTLFRLIAGEISPDGGTIEQAKQMKVGMLRQEFADTHITILDTVLAADTERQNLFQELETCDDPYRMGDIYQRLEEIEAYSAPSRAAIILTGLGFDESLHSKQLAEFSGGWQMRVALAAVLFSAPEILLLDEPSNHLDFESQTWLESYLCNYPHSFIMISHDRDMLNNTVDSIIHLEEQKLVSYTGNYDQFERLRAEKRKHQQIQITKQQSERKKMQAFVDRFRAKASKARQAQSRLKMLEKMELIDDLIAERTVEFHFPEPQELPSPLITLDKVDIGYHEKPVLKQLSLRVDMDDRIALLGANGNGKSTLIKLLCGELAAMSGEVQRSGKLKIGYFAQHQTDIMDPTQTGYALLKNAMKDLHESKVRALLGRFGFDRQKADTKVGELSGGEKSRLLFCMMSYHAPHVLLLDEPTNHLDLEAKEGLIRALNNYQGAVIIVSHDAHLISHVVDRLWLVANGTCRPYDGDVESYRQYVLDEKKRSKQENASSKLQVSKKNEKSDVKKPSLSKIESEIALLTAKKEKVETSLVKASSQGDAAQLSNLATDLATITKKLESLEAEWFQAQTKQ